MVLEATVLCLDSSEFMRNGDFQPTRLQAQRDAANLVVGTKLRDNPESTVGLLSMGQKIDVLSTLTRDKGKVLACLHDIQPTGTCDFVSGIQVGQLILKHRQSKNHRQRIIVFVGSPVQATEKQLVQLAKKLKKSNVSVDVISFGEEDTNQSKLEAFISTVNKEDNSHLVVVPSGSGRLSDSIMSSPMFAAESAPAGPAGGMGEMDLDNDPELAMALRISLEEERQRQRSQGDGSGEQAQQEGQQQQEEEAQPEQVPSSGTGEQAEQPAQPSSQAPAQAQAQGGVPNFEAMTEEEMLQYAMSMSLQEQQASMDTGADEPAAKASKPEAEGKKEEGEDAKQKKEKGEEKKEEKKEPPKDEAAEGAMDIFQDPAYLSSVLGDLPGVDPSDTQVQEMLASLSKQDEKKEGDDKDKKEDKDKQ